MQQHFTVSRLARRYGIPPRKISDLFYCRKLSDEACPVVDGRRLIPEWYVRRVEDVLREEGLIPSAEICSVSE